MNSHANTLFELFDGVLESSSHQTRDAVVSRFHDFPWTHDQYQALQPLVRRELDDLLFHLLGALNNVGGAIPANASVTGYSIKAHLAKEALPETFIETSNLDVVDTQDDNRDYQDMWLTFRRDKLSVTGLTK